MAVSLAIIVALGLLADALFKKMKLPGLVGMLIVGILAGPYVFNLLKPDMMRVSADFRKIALIVILLRAGFELRKDTLHRVGKSALLMATVPAIFELGAVVFLGARFLGLSYMDAAILGSILAAVSPAVVVPLMINFMERGLGARKGIPTLILAASSVDDVFVIVIFTILVGAAVGAKVSLAWQLASIPISIVLGILVGLVPGYLLFKLFRKYDWQAPRRTLVVMAIAIGLTWMEDALHDIVPVAALLGVMAVGFMILEKEEALAHIISQKLKKLWVFAELLLFVLVGAQVNIHVAWDAGAMGLLVIFIGLIFRSMGTWFSLAGSDLDNREKLFSVVAYIPKATVQAAIGAIPMEMGLPGGEVILAVAVLSILVTAPIGAIGIMIMGERILEPEEMSIYRFKSLREQLNLPRVGQRIRSRVHGTQWKIVEEREIWLRDEQGQPIPGIFIKFWKPDSAEGPGTGKTMDYRYSHLDPSFHSFWELMEA